MSSNLADLPLDQLADLPLSNDYLVVKMSSNLATSTLPVLTPSGQDEYKFGRSTPKSDGRCTPQYLYLVVKMSSNLADLPPSIDI